MDFTGNLRPHSPIMLTHCGHPQASGSPCFSFRPELKTRPLSDCDANVNIKLEFSFQWLLRQGIHIRELILSKICSYRLEPASDSVFLVGWIRNRAIIEGEK